MVIAERHVLPEASATIDMSVGRGHRRKPRGMCVGGSIEGCEVFDAFDQASTVGSADEEEAAPLGTDFADQFNASPAWR